MKPTIEELLFQILSTCLLVTNQGKWHVFFDYYGHVQEISIRVSPASTDYDVIGHTSERRSFYLNETRYRSLESIYQEAEDTLAFVQRLLSHSAISQPVRYFFTSGHVDALPLSPERRFVVLAPPKHLQSIRDLFNAKPDLGAAA